MSLTVAPTDVEHGPIWTTASILGAQLKQFSSGAAPASVAWPAANQAYLLPFLVSAPVTFVEIFFQAGTTPGTTAYDLGIYNDQFARLVSLGATNAVSTTSAVLPVGGGTITATTLQRGRYYMAMSSAATTLTVLATIPANQLPRAIGMFTMATAHPLPPTFVPASMGTTTFIPTIGLATVTNIL